MSIQQERADAIHSLHPTRPGQMGVEVHMNQGLRSMQVGHREADQQPAGQPAHFYTRTSGGLNYQEFPHDGSPEGRTAAAGRAAHWTNTYLDGFNDKRTQ